MIDNNYFYEVLTLAFVIGAALGSFVTMASYRLPRGEEIVFHPSYCPTCKTTLRIPDLFPLLSWIFQRARCRYCRTSISARYPIIELTMGLTVTGLVYMYGLGMTALILGLLATELAILIATDIEQFIIPDAVQVALAATGLFYCLWRQADPETVGISVAAGLGIGLLLHYGYLYLRKKDALGWGDVKFMAVVGTWLPVHDFVTFYLFAGVIGTLTGLMWGKRDKGGIFPFGPALAVSLFINVLFPDIIGRIAL